MPKRKLLYLLVGLLSGFASAQSPLAWLDSLLSTEEHLLHRVEVGPYLVSADGQRLLDNPYLDLSVEHEGRPVSADTTLTVQSTLYGSGNRVERSYRAVREGETFFVDLDLSEAETWAWYEGGWLELDLVVSGPVGSGQGNAGFSVYPPKLEAGILFRLLSFGLPLVLLGLVTLAFGLRGVPLSRAASE